MHEVEHGRLKEDEARHDRPKALHWVVEVACLGKNNSRLQHHCQATDRGGKRDAALVWWRLGPAPMRRGTWTMPSSP